MSPTTLFLINVLFYAAFPICMAALKSPTRSLWFYIYIAIVLVVGGLMGSIYSIQLSDTITLSGGSIAYGAFMMAVVVLIILEHEVGTIHNMIGLLILVDTFVFLLFRLTVFLLENGYSISDSEIVSLFRVSLPIMLLGGVLILVELTLLLGVFTYVQKHSRNLSLTALIFTVTFVVVVCLDGILFPLLAFGFSENLVEIVKASFLAKLVLALAYSLPLMMFYMLFRGRLEEFVATPIELAHLFTPRIKLIEILGEYRERDEVLQRKNAELTEVSILDSLTGLYNRRYFDSSLAVEWERAQRNHTQLSLIIGDIDHFKEYNDHYGHNEGDNCLKEIAALWGKIFHRPSDIAARIGGEEFAIILPETSIEQCEANLATFREQLVVANIPHAKSKTSDRITMSIGGAHCLPDRDANSTELFTLADRRLYAAKNGGRDRFILS